MVVGNYLLDGFKEKYGLKALYHDQDVPCPEREGSCWKKMSKERDGRFWVRVFHWNNRLFRRLMKPKRKMPW